MAARARTRGVRARRGRKLRVEEARFFASVYGAARRGCVGELCRHGCDEEEAEEVFATALEKVMERVDPIDRDFSAAQMVNFIKRACWTCLIDERRRRGLRTELSLSSVYSVDDSAAESPAEAAEEREAVAAGKEALEMLPERDRAIFRQRHQMNLSPKEIVQGTPGLSLRSYRKIMQRANAKVLAAYERIETGERCEELESGLLRRYVAEETSAGERRAVEAHLAHCRACQLSSAEMRDYLLDVASGLLATGALSGVARPDALSALGLRLAHHASDGAHALAHASKTARERVRELLLRLATGMPGQGGESASFGQAITAPSVKVASVCAAGLAAGACVASGIVPGIGAVSLLNQPHHQARHHAKPAGHVSPPANEPSYLAPAPTGTSEAALEAEAPAEVSSSTRHRKRRSSNGSSGTESSTRKHSSTSNSASSARSSASQTATEFGFESGASSSAPSSSSTSSGSSSSSASSTSSSSSEGSVSEGSGTGGGSGSSTHESSSGSAKSSGSGSGSEFGF